MSWTDDPLADFEAHDAEQEEALRRLPVCYDCGEHIQDEYYYCIGGKNICPSCLEDYREWID